jgi:hypothetical protein
MTWQVNWKRWYWPWWNSEEVWYYEPINHTDNFCYKSNFGGFGPFQFHWYSK